MNDPEQSSMEKAYREAWNAFVAGGRIEPAFGSRSSGEMLHLVFLCPVGGLPEVTSRVAPVQQRVSFPYADLVPGERLHVSIQNFDVELPEWLERREEVLAAARGVFASVPPFTLWLGWLNSFPMAAFLRAEDGSKVRRLRAALREALPAWTGLRRDPMVQDGEDQWLPHLSLAYYNTVGNNQALVEAITPLRDEVTVNAQVREIRLMSTPEDLTGADRWVWPVHHVFRLGVRDQE